MISPIESGRTVKVSPTSDELTAFFACRYTDVLRNMSIGSPSITPVTAFRIRPSGSVPFTIKKEGFSPVIEGVSLYLFPFTRVYSVLE